MIITLKGADFNKSNIGTLSTWRISRSLGVGATYEGVTSVNKGAAFSATVTLAESYEIGAGGVIVTMGGATLSDAYSISNNVITITITEVTGNVLIKVSTAKSKPKNIYTITWEAGGIDVNSGNDNTMENRRRSVGYIPVKYVIAKANNTVGVHVIYYDKDYNYVKSTGDATFAYSVTSETTTFIAKYIPTNAVYMRLVARTGNTTQDSYWYPLETMSSNTINPLNLTWESGGIDVNSGKENTADNRRRSIGFISVDNSNATTSESVSVHVLYYDLACKYLGTTMTDGNYGFISMTPGTTINLCEQAPSGTEYFRLVARTSNAEQDNYWTFIE